ncbi:MAG: hypothetical protein AAF684_07695 [Pseudomonadota bacterium]
MGFRTTVVASASKIQRDALNVELRAHELEPVTVEHPTDACHAAKSWEAAVAVVDLSADVEKPLQVLKSVREQVGEKVVLLALAPSVSPKVVGAVLKAGGDDVTLLGAPPKSIVKRVRQWLDIRTTQSLPDRRRQVLDKLNAGEKA